MVVLGIDDGMKWLITATSDRTYGLKTGVDWVAKLTNDNKLMNVSSPTLGGVAHSYDGGHAVDQPEYGPNAGRRSVLVGDLAATSDLEPRKRYRFWAVLFKNEAKACLGRQLIDLVLDLTLQLWI